MNSEGALLFFGTVLLVVCALIGFVRYRHRKQPKASARWGLVHVGGTGGAAQLLVLALLWKRFGSASSALTAGLIGATLAPFVGLLARALSWPRTAQAFIALAAVVALPIYLAVPAILLF